ncbi:glycerol acyltransferase [Hwanghaeella grinnelliae]|uniref:Glycerol acyltransferase n=1 Tax=Hwanghaeella grinnelliae TaxID=2500179 RepID=A0A3S3UNZ5_9PROT|nr:lysophospholipid acyltransferase family protein [Hwanghaeella grinnelliae]RVU36458.1 glycerol acyltransferase [Hwanghaeella grinnelliae]
MTDVTEIPTISYATDGDPMLRRALIRVIEKISGQRRLKRLYDEYRLQGGSDRPFWQEAIDRLRVGMNVDARQLDAMPAEGPLIVVSNHPFGVLDGLSACHLVSQRRADIKLMAHATFERAPELRPYLLPIQFEGASSALRSNVAARQAALQHLRDGGVVIIFPAGRVSTADKIFGPATDAPWKLFVSAMVQRSNATILPIYFEGQNSWRFHLASRIGEAWREALLMYELARRIGSDVTVRIGEPVHATDLPNLDDRHQLLADLRRRVYALEGTSS